MSSRKSTTTKTKLTTTTTSTSITARRSSSRLASLSTTAKRSLQTKPKQAKISATRKKAAEVALLESDKYGLTTQIVSTPVAKVAKKSPKQTATTAKSSATKPRKTVIATPTTTSSITTTRPPIINSTRSPQLPLADTIIRPLIAERSNGRDVTFVENFFQCGPGQYAEGDKLLGLRTPELHTLVKESIELFQTKYNKTIQDISLQNDVYDLIHDPYNDVRFVGYQLLIKMYQHTPQTQKNEIIDFYLTNCHSTRNWNLVDSTAYMLLGDWLKTRTSKNERKILYQLAESDDFWEQRVGIVSTLSLIKNDDYNDILNIAKYHLEPQTFNKKINTTLSPMESSRLSLYHNPHNHLSHKAIGWMLREVGKRGQAGRDALNTFLSTNDMYLYLPTHTYSYSLEKHSPTEKEPFLRKKSGNVFIKPQ